MSKTISVRVVAMDQTKYWDIPPQWKDVIEGIYGVYIVNMDETVHCCEITPSRMLMFVYFHAKLRDEHKYNNELAEQIDEWLLDNSGDDNDCYLWASRIDNIPCIEEKAWDVEEGQTSDEAMCFIADHYRSNPVTESRFT